MIAGTDILTDSGLGELISIIIFLIVVVVSILAKIGEKRMHQTSREEVEEQRRRREATERAAAQQRQSPGQPPQPIPTHGARRYPPIPQRQPAGPQVTPAPQPIPSQAVRRYPPMPQRRAPGMVPPQPPAPQVFPSLQTGPMVQGEPTAAQPPPPLGEPPPRTVEQEIVLLQSRLAKLERVRKKRFTALVSPEADTAAIEARLISIRPAIRSRVPEVAALRAAPTVDLADRDKARAAIVLHEIFSRPLAMRSQPEMWDV